MNYERLFSKAKIGGVTLKNRIVMSPMHDGLGGTGGDVGIRAIEYYAARAKGGAGLIINGFTVVCPEELSGTTCAGQSHLVTLDNRNSFQYLAERVHESGAKFFVQLHHPGRAIYAPDKVNGGRQPVSCTALPESMQNDRTAVPAHELTADEIHMIEECFAEAASSAYMAGCDGVELHCAHGYLFSQFIAPAKNERTDEYGGSVENNCRIVTETLELIRKRVPRRFPVVCRINGEEGDFRPNGTEEDMAYMRQAVVLLVEHGADAIDVSIGGVDCISSPDVVAGDRDSVIKNIKDAVSVPVIAVNTIKTPGEAEKMLEDGISDFVSLGRELIADPEWANKAKSGREDEIVPCLSCNDCIMRSAMQAPVRCSVNPLAGREAEDNALTPGSGNVVVIGAGPAGIEASLTLAEKGYDVLLVEKAHEIGGSLQLANKAPGKFRIDNLIEYYKKQIEKNSRITLKTGFEVTEEALGDFEKLSPKAVVLASGGIPIIPPFPGAEDAVTAHDVLSGRIDIQGKNVVVIGGGMTGMEAAKYLTYKGNQVIICEMTSMFGSGTFIFTVVKDRFVLASMGVGMKKRTLVTAYQDGMVLIKDLRSGEEGALPADFAVLAQGVKPDDRLLRALETRFDTVLNLGDSRKPGKIYDAVSDAFHSIKKF